MRFSLACVFAAVVAAAPLSAAQAAAPWVYRDLVLPRHDVALDFGLGIGHEPQVTGLGLNLELEAGLGRDFELGFRAGFRLDDAGQTTKADRYGRPFDNETYGTFHDRIADPELRLLWSVARATAAELGIELRFYLPIEANSRFGFMVGLPIRLRTGVLRVDTGIYVPVIFTNPTETVVSVPLHIWIQATRTLWLGPLLGLQVINAGGGSHTGYPLGFGLGSALSRAIDLRLWFLFPDMNQDAAARFWGAGIALQIRFE
jgi:hypothetical protein